MENVVPIERLSGLIEQTIDQVNAGVAAARSKGIVVDLPDEVSITATVIGEWQALEQFQETNDKGSETQGGSTKETTDGSESSEQERVSSETRDSEEKTERNNEKSGQNRTLGTGGDERKSIDGGASTTKVNRESEDTTENDNGHNQQQETNYSYGE